MTLGAIQGIDTAAGSEYFTGLIERRCPRDQSRRGGLVFPGGTGNNRSFISDDAQGQQIPRALADVHIPLLSADFGGGSKHAAPITQTRLGQAWTKLKAELGVKTDKAVVLGVSQGFSAVAKWMRDNPTLVSACVGIVPEVNISAIYDEPPAGRLGLRATIDAAYASAGGWAANKAAHDPMLNVATHAAQAIPTLLAYASDDPAVFPAEVVAYAAAVGPSVTLVNLGAVGHSGATVDPLVVLNFLEAHL